MAVVTLHEQQAGLRKPDPIAQALPIEIGLLTGGQDPHYAFGLATALAAQGVGLDLVGSDLMDAPELRRIPRVRFLNLYGSKEETSTAGKIKRTALAYVRLLKYAAQSHAQIFHILWNHKFEFFDRTLLLLYYKLLGKKVALTAHNVNAGRRDGHDSWLNRRTLKIQYRLADHIFVHTEKMKRELVNEFSVSEAAVTVIPYGVNNAVPDTALSVSEARQRLGIGSGEKAILFFGALKPYKGLEYLVAAFQQVAKADVSYRLIIAGERKKGYEDYWDNIRSTIEHDPTREHVIQKIEFISDNDTELYFKAADVAVLPYTEIFQSGILILALSFGLPVIASDVGSLAEYVDEGSTGYIVKPCDSQDLAQAIEKYFASDLFQELASRRPEIRARAHARHSWDVVGESTRNVYSGLLA